MQEFTPRPYQAKIIDFILTHRRGAVYAGMGMGKTSSTLCALERLKKEDDAFPALILAPLRVASSTWPQEILKWGFNLSCSCITGTPKQRVKTLTGAPADIYTTNYEQIPWLAEYFGISGLLRPSSLMSLQGSNPFVSAAQNPRARGP